MNILDDVMGKGKVVNVAEELLGKEVIDGHGKLVGQVKDIVWNFRSNEVESLLVEDKSGGLLSRIGSGEKQIIPYNRIHSIGDRILIDAEFDECLDLGLNQYRLEI